MVRRDDLQYEGLYLYQDDTLPCFSADSVQLVHFFRLKPTDRVLDIGCGTGILSILGEGYTGASFTGIDIDGRLTALAERSAKENGQEIAFHTMDFHDAVAAFGHGSFSAVVCNPPYFTAAGSETDMDGPRHRARHMERGELKVLAKVMFDLLKNRGKAYVCYPVAGLATITHELTAARLTVKRMRLVGNDPSRAPALALLEARKDGGEGMVMEPVLYVGPASGNV